jgi:SAM-dependent methyltransferase
MSIAATEKILYEGIWANLPTYGDHSPGAFCATAFNDLVIERHGSAKGLTVLDAGTGSGKGAVALKAFGFTVRLCDITDAGLIDDAKSLPFTEASLYRDLSHVAQGVGHPGRTKFDYTYCCDVMEHIPPQFTMLAIDQMLRVSKYGVFLSVSLVPDSFGVWVGERLHKTVESFVWWRDSLAELGNVLDARDLHNSALFLVGRR